MAIHPFIHFCIHLFCHRLLWHMNESMFSVWCELTWHLIYTLLQRQLLIWLFICIYLVAATVNVVYIIQMCIIIFAYFACHIFKECHSDTSTAFVPIIKLRNLMGPCQENVDAVSSIPRKWITYSDKQLKMYILQF